MVCALPINGLVLYLSDDVRLLSIEATIGTELFFDEKRASAERMKKFVIVSLVALVVFFSCYIG